MFQALRKVVTGNNSKDPRNSLVQDEFRKKNLKDNLALHIKQLQKAHVNGTQVIERNDEDAAHVCQALEAIFLHEYQTQGRTIPANINLRMMFTEGIRSNDAIISLAFWDLLKEVTHNDVITELKHLVVTTEVGLCRAWIRLALNDCLIVSYLDAILSNTSQLSHFYGVNAFLMDTELPFILKELLQGLMQFELRLNYNSSKLNTWDKKTLQLAGILEYIDKDKDNNYQQNIPKRSFSTTTLRSEQLVKDDIVRSISVFKDKRTIGNTGSKLHQENDINNFITATVSKPEINNENTLNSPTSKYKKNTGRIHSRSKEGIIRSHSYTENVSNSHLENNKLTRHSQQKIKKITNHSPSEKEEIINHAQPKDGTVLARTQPEKEEVINHSFSEKEKNTNNSQSKVNKETVGDSISAHQDDPIKSIQNSQNTEVGIANNCSLENNVIVNLSKSENEVDCNIKTSIPASKIDDLEQYSIKTEQNEDTVDLTPNFVNDKHTWNGTCKQDEIDGRNSTSSDIISGITVEEDSLQRVSTSSTITMEVEEENESAVPDENDAVDVDSTNYQHFSGEGGNTEENIGERNVNGVVDTLLPGNRLNGTGWSGWSSTFDNTNEIENTSEIEESADSMESERNELNESFGSLLQIYGTINPTSEITPNEIFKTELQLNKSGEFKETDIGEESNTSETDNVPETPTDSHLLLNHLNFEVVPMDMPLQGQNVDKKTLSSLNQLTELSTEQGLDNQSFCCKHCGVLIGLIYGPYRVCRFDGGYYCHDCHDEEVHIIPAKVIQDWDFRKYQVSKYNKVFLMKIEEEPLFHMDEINSLLYDVVPDLKGTKYLRIQLQHIKEYIQTCRHEISEDFRRRLWPREYLCDDIHQYSLLDLLQVYNGQLAHHLKRVITQFSKHIYKCTLCCQKGFICEYCHDETIIYPFQVNIAVQCQSCSATYHKKCRQDKRCPKCVRIRLRSQSTGKKDDKINRMLSVTQKEQFTNSDIL